MPLAGGGLADGVVEAFPEVARLGGADEVGIAFVSLGAVDCAFR